MSNERPIRGILIFTDDGAVTSQCLEYRERRKFWYQTGPLTELFYDEILPGDNIVCAGMADGDSSFNASMVVYNVQPGARGSLIEKAEEPIEPLYKPHFQTPPVSTLHETNPLATARIDYVVCQHNNQVLNIGDDVGLDGRRIRGLGPMDAMPVGNGATLIVQYGSNGLIIAADYYPRGLQFLPDEAQPTLDRTWAMAVNPKWLSGLEVTFNGKTC